MYKSPIEVFQTNIEHQIENEIMSMVQKYGITVDKDELLKALHYDRDQYDKGYADGKVAAIDELVRCTDCQHFGARVCFIHSTPDGFYAIEMHPSDYCSYGERRVDHD